MAFRNNDNLPSRKNQRGLSSISGIDDLFDRFRNEFFSSDFSRNGEEGFMPKVEVKETDKSIFVCAELPGMKENDITVTLRESNLIIEGEKKIEKEKKDKDRYSSEFSYGSFYRSIPLWTDVDSDKVEATYKNGILEVTLNKLNEGNQKSKKIEIKH